MKSPREATKPRSKIELSVCAEPEAAPEARHDRRTFLTMVAGAALLCACSKSDGSPAAFGDVSAGNVKDVPIGGIDVVSGAPALLARDSGGLYAMTITCTHQGCDVEPVGSGSSTVLDCPCHGSQFDANCNVIRGPAGSPLVHFAVDVSAAGDITIHGGRQVPATTRTAVA